MAYLQDKLKTKSIKFNSHGHPFLDFGLSEGYERAASDGVERRAEMGKGWGGFPKFETNCKDNVTVSTCVLARFPA